MNNNEDSETLTIITIRIENSWLYPITVFFMNHSYYFQVRRSDLPDFFQFLLIYAPPTKTCYKNPMSACRFQLNTVVHRFSSEATSIHIHLRTKMMMPSSKLIFAVVALLSFVSATPVVVRKSSFDRCHNNCIKETPDVRYISSGQLQDNMLTS